ncbi:hypothetical protein KQI65_05195 [bacterium]|nr:hypothetical protein [bacterium]
MDPNLWHLDWERTFEALMGIVVLSFVVERAVSLLVESRWWIGKFEDSSVAKKRNAVAHTVTSDPAAGEGNAGTKPENASTAGNVATAAEQPLPAQRYPLKELLAFLVAVLICWRWDFDAVSIILLTETTTKVGVVITAAVIAGGSKASIKLFHDVFNMRSSALREKQQNSGNVDGQR